MTLLEEVRKLWDHLFWADVRLFEALPEGRGRAEAAREFAHILGTEETWLSRLEQRSPRAPVWPDLSREETRKLMEATHSAWRAYLAGLQEADLTSAVAYANSAGRQFKNSIADILGHVALHGQYHRGKVNLLLRQTGRAPAPTDYIAFVRGVPAATEASRKGAMGSG